MLATARAIAMKLHGELRDENRSVMMGQTIEHCRQRIRDFDMQSRLRAR
jgi:cell division protein ZipA